MISISHPMCVRHLLNCPRSLPSKLTVNKYINTAVSTNDFPTPSSIWCLKTRQWLCDVSKLKNMQMRTIYHKVNQPQNVWNQFHTDQLKCLSLYFANTCSYATSTNTFSLTNKSFDEFVSSLVEEYKELMKRKESGIKLDANTTRRIEELQPVGEQLAELKLKYEEVEELNKLLADEDMKVIAGEEKEKCLEEITDMEEQLFALLLPHETLDDNDIILELESGAGGQEAMLFLQEMLGLYRNFSHYKGWEFKVIHSELVDNCGIRKASASIRGFGVYQLMKHESGVHRVQRVPKTENKGRIHTSTISVAILPQPTEIQVELHQRDLKIDTFRSSGPGGQNAQKVESAVRVTHLPTGLTSECQQTRSQSENLKIAMDVLRTRLYNIQLEEQISQQTTLRKLQAGCKDRSEKIRTYNFPQNRITDHRLGHNYNNIDTFMEGNTSLEKLILELLETTQVETLKLMMEEFQQSKKSRGQVSKGKS